MDVFKTVTHYLKNTDLYLMFLALICSGYGMVLIYSATLNPASWQDGSTRNLFIQGAAILMGLAAFVVMSLIDLEAMSGWWKILCWSTSACSFCCLRRSVWRSTASAHGSI